jgi:Isochorismatase family
MNGSAAEREVLIIIDPQIDFCTGGAFVVPGGDEIVPTVNRLARDFPHVILTQDWHPPGHRSFASAHPGRRFRDYRSRLRRADAVARPLRTRDKGCRISCPLARLAIRLPLKAQCRRPEGGVSRLNTQPMRTPVNASSRPSWASAHDSGTVWFATP